MRVIGSFAQPAQRRHRIFSNGLLPTNKAGTWITGFMGREYKDCSSANGPRPSPEQIFPMAYLVEQDPYSYLNPHFHVADQFQVFTSGGGTIGGEAIQPISFHFVAKYSPYGPIEAGRQGLHYFTLRNGFDPGSRFMPAARAELPRSRTFRQVYCGPLPTLQSRDLASLRSPLLEEALERKTDGLAVWQCFIPPDSRFCGPLLSLSGGQHILVCLGDLVLDGQLLPPNSCVFLSPDEEPLSGTAGPGGAYLLVFQYPRRAEPATAERH
jgi:hypothetical protein